MTDIHIQSPWGSLPNVKTNEWAFERGSNDNSNDYRDQSVYLSRVVNEQLQCAAEVRGCLHAFSIKLSRKQSAKERQQLKEQIEALACCLSDPRPKR